MTLSRAGRTSWRFESNQLYAKNDWWCRQQSEGATFGSSESPSSAQTPQILRQIECAPKPGPVSHDVRSDGAPIQPWCEMPRPLARVAPYGGEPAAKKYLGDQGDEVDRRPDLLLAQEGEWRMTKFVAQMWPAAR